VDKDQLWKIVLGEIEVTTSKANFATWFSKTEIMDATDTKVIVGTPNNFHKEFLKKNFDKAIRQALVRHMPNLRAVDYVVRLSTTPQPAAPALFEEETVTPIFKAKEELPDAPPAKLNPKYTFETFVVGENTRIAHAACETAARNPGMTYNPLFIYGGVGLGKTHLLQAVGNEVVKIAPKKIVLYVTSEHFTNEYVDAIKNQKTKEFRNKYRKIDCLLIDDIQFLSGKEAVQEAFFWTFNALYEDGRQIVIASDQIPKQIPALEERLRSRLEWGLIVDVSPPDYETRLAILQSKTQPAGVELPDAALRKIASQAIHNVRELEGAFNRIVAYTQLNGSVPTEAEIDSLLSGLLGEARPKSDIKPAEVIKAVSQYYKISKEEIVGKKRNREIVMPRQMAIYLLREELDLPYKSIGDLLGGRDHSTVMHDYKKIKKALIDDVEILGELKKIKTVIYNK
jgi:chromosomal replication initiator protein